MTKVLDTAARYAKALVAFVVPAGGTLIAAMQDASPGGSTITGPEWFAAFLIAATASASVGATPNKRPVIVVPSPTVDAAALARAIAKASPPSSGDSKVDATFHDGQ